MSSTTKRRRQNEDHPFSGNTIAMNDAITLDTTTQGRRVNADVMTLTTMSANAEVSNLGNYLMNSCLTFRERKAITFTL